MRLLIVRHAIAEEREAFARTGEPDERRPLTARGREKMRKAAGGLRRAVPSIDLLATSPLARAVQTAEILRAQYRRVRTLAIPELEPDRPPAALVRWLRARPAGATVAIVGHEPHLGRLIAQLTAGRAAPVTSLKKGQACLLDLPDGARAGGATILWSLQPGHLRRMA